MKKKLTNELTLQSLKKLHTHLVEASAYLGGQLSEDALNKYDSLEASMAITLRLYSRLIFKEMADRLAADATRANHMISKQIQVAKGAG